MVNPPYVYGYLPGPAEESAVFWCKSLRQEGVSILVFVFKGALEHELTKCPDKIEWRNPPGGLSVYRKRGATLEGFVYLDNPSKKAPGNVPMKSPGILSEYDGVGEVFYCYKGKWLVSQFD